MLAFLHLSLGRQKATSDTFSTDGFGWLGLNPAGVSLFRMHVERCPSGPLSSIQARRKLLVHGRPLPGFPGLFKQFRRCLSGDVRQLRWPFFIFLEGVRKQRQAVFRRMVLAGWA